MKLCLSILSILSFVLFFVNSPLVFAENNDLNTGSLNSAIHGRDSSTSADFPSNHESSTSGKGRNLLNFCENKQAYIKIRMTNMAKYLNKNGSNLDNIAQRVENYYTTKLVLNGQTLSNYDTLVSDISSKSAALKTALAVSQNDVDSFSCTGNPRDQLKKFNTDMENSKKSLRAYQGSIKNLTAAIRTLFINTHLDNKEGTKSADGSESSKLK